MSDERKVALVTGSTSGIGLACARVLAQRGVDVIINGLGDAETINKILSEIQSCGVNAHYVAADLSNSSEVDSLWSEISRLYPNGLDILVNGAGLIHLGLIEDSPDEMWEKSIAVMLTAPFKLIRACIPGMKTKGWGRIVNISSTFGIIAGSHQAAYCAAKHGIIGLTKGVALETAANGITCNAVCPGFTETPMMQKVYEDFARLTHCTVDELKAKWKESYPIRTHNTPQQIAELVEFLCLSNASSQMTGASYLIDRGYTAQ